MPELDPVMADILTMIAARGLRPYHEMQPAEARAESEARNAFWNEGAPAVEKVEDVTIEGPRGPLLVRLYFPEGLPDPAPALIYLHGGGWVIGSPRTHDNVCRRLALAGRFAVASVDYALAPEHPFPQGLADCTAAVRWFGEHGQSEGIDPARLVLGGDSAGANLALATCLRLRDTKELHLVRAAALIYGCFSPDLQSPSHAAFGSGQYFLGTATMSWFHAQYVQDPDARNDALVSPLFANLEGLPPLYVAAAELDPLRDDSERLARRLIESGVSMDYRLWRGVTHGCIQMSRSLPIASGFIREISGFLARHMH